MYRSNRRWHVLLLYLLKKEDTCFFSKLLQMTEWGVCILSHYFSSQIHYMPPWLLMPHLELLCIEGERVFSRRPHSLTIYRHTVEDFNVFYCQPYKVQHGGVTGKQQLLPSQYRAAPAQVTLNHMSYRHCFRGVQTLSAAKGTNKEFCLYQVCRNCSLYEVTQRLHEFLFQL